MMWWMVGVEVGVDGEESVLLEEYGEKVKGYFVGWVRGNGNGS